MSFEDKVAQNIKTNEEYLKEFEFWLRNYETMTEEEIEANLNNAKIYINEYLNYYDAVPMAEGTFSILGFFEGWFLVEKHCPSKKAFLEMAESLKIFYKCMNRFCNVTNPNYLFLLKMIDGNMEKYLKAWEAYDNGTYYDIF